MSRTYDALASITLTTASATVDFTNIPLNYTDLFLIMQLQSVSAATTWGYTMRFNSDGGTNYSTTWLYGNGASVASTRQSTATSLRLGGDLPATRWSINQVHILNYASTGMFKTFINPNGDAGADVNLNCGLWRSTAAINAIQIRGNNDGAINMAVGSTFQLFGVRAES